MKIAKTKLNAFDKMVVQHLLELFQRKVSPLNSNDATDWNETKPKPEFARNFVRITKIWHLILLFFFYPLVFRCLIPIFVEFVSKLFIIVCLLGFIASLAHSKLSLSLFTKLSCYTSLANFNQFYQFASTENAFPHHTFTQSPSHKVILRHQFTLITSEFPISKFK